MTVSRLAASAGALVRRALVSRALLRSLPRARRRAAPDALLGALLGALVLLTPAAPRAAEVELRLHQFLPITSTIPAKAIEPWIDRIEAASGGRIAITHFPSMQLGGKPPALYDQARDGVVDIVWTVLGYTPGRFPRSEAIELPWLVTTGEATSRAFHRYAMAHAADEFPGVKVIALHTHGPGVLHFRGEGVSSLEDMAGKKIRGPSRVITSLLSAYGATAIGMPVPAVPEALSKGVIDGVAIPWQVTTALKIPELADAHTEFTGDRGLYTIGFIFAMNQARYDALPDDLKAVIDANSGVALAAEFGRAMDLDDVVGREAADAAGIRVRRLDAAETARWVAAAEPVVARWIDDMTDKGFDGAALAAAARALVDEETAKAAAE